MSTENLQHLPDNLPVPQDDGAANHLPGLQLPSVSLQSTPGRRVDTGALAGRVVLYVYPMTGRPGTALPQGWNELPGARGCTPQSCAFRDHHQELRVLGAEVFGVSTQASNEQQEAVARLHLPFELLSDSRLEFAQALRLPTFQIGEAVYLKRLTLIINDGQVEKVFYPVLPPDKNAEQIIDYLRRSTR